MAVVYSASATTFKEATVQGTTVKPMIPYPQSQSGTSSEISSFVSSVISNNIAAIPDKGSIVIVITGKEES